MKKGTILWFVKKYSEQLVPFIVSSIDEFKNLFLPNGIENKQNLTHFKKFLNQFTSLYLNELKDILKKQSLHIIYVTECIETINEYARDIDRAVNLK